MNKCIYSQEQYDKINNELNLANLKIHDLQEQLKNAIVPKFKVGQEVYTFNKPNDCVHKLSIEAIRIAKYKTNKFDSIVYGATRDEDGFFTGYCEDELFATREEAEAKLKELKESD